MPALKLSFAEITRRQVVGGLVSFGASSLCRQADGQVMHADDPQPKRSSSARADSKNPTWLTLPPTPELPSTARSGLITVNRTSIFFAQFGEGPPVLLLHGGLANSSYWAYQIDDLVRNHTVIVMDTRGHGRSPVTSNTFTYEMFSDDVSGLLDALKIPTCSIVGWSDGAITGLQLAMAKPSRVSKLFAFGANSSLEGLKADGARSSVFASFTDRCRTEYNRLSPHPERWPELVEGLRIMWRTEPNFTKQKLATLKIPTTVSDGEYDEIIKRDHTKELARAILGARLVIQPEVSHFAMLQNPAQFNKALIDFLKA